MNHLVFDTKDILIVDDTQDNLRILSSILVKEGYKVRKALNWQMAFTACQTLLPDLILLDIIMPEMDGYEICQHLKTSKITADIPIIFISALEDVFDKVKAFKAGGVDYIIKPFEFSEVLVRVQNQLALRTAKLQVLKLNAQLEQTVKERTWELETALEKLQREITYRNELQNKLIDIALHDPLTRLPNRVLFIKRLEKALQRAKQEPDYEFAVLFLDGDRFKVVNDSLGHFVGDELLIAMAQRLRNTISPCDILARFGGDEFAILLENLTDRNMAIEVAENILQQLSLVFQLSQNEVFINVSIGINWGNTNYQTAEYLLRDADTAMYRAKALGRSRYHVFDPQMHQEAIRLLELENDLRRAIERQEFVIYYQPIVSLSTDKIIGFEALLRWQHPTKGLIHPTEFIPLAEEIGLIHYINIWVLQSACHQLSLWRNHSTVPENLTMSVNLCAQFFANLKTIEIVDEIISKTYINPACLALEITESIIMENSDIVKLILPKLKERKIKLIMDDFGTGYSSLSYLHRFPLDGLKIDKSFVKRMQANQEVMGLVPAMIGIAHSMGIKAIAEGVETKDQLTQLRNLNCDFAQGYLISRPLKKELILDLIATPIKW